MGLSEGIQELAEEIANRHGIDSSNSPILLLGAGCARAANVPSPAEIARQFFKSSLYRLASKIMPDLIPNVDGLDNDQIVSAFNKYLNQLPTVQRSMILEKFYRGIPVPLFYQDLAVLIKAGYFNHILTTNFDSLLEDAMYVAGLRKGSDFHVVDLRAPAESAPPRWVTGSSEHQVVIIKLDGDLERGDPIHLQGALGTVNPFVLRALQGDLVMVGYEFENEYVNYWLSRPNEKQLWWVSPVPPDHELVDAIQQARAVKFIDGANAGFEEFFGQMALMLLRLPILESMTVSIDDSETTDDSLSFKDMLSKARLSDDYLEREYLQDKLRRCQEVLYGLGQLTVAGEKNLSLQIQNQIEYQKRQIARLEDQLRQLSTSKPRVVKLLGQIIKSAQNTADASTISFLQSQVDAVKQEYEHEEPNQHIISAAIGATVVLAERLGSDVVESEVLDELITFAPSTAVKGA